MVRLVSRCALALGAGAFVPSALLAQATAIAEQSACAQARAGAGVASPCADGSAIVYNPAAIGAAGNQLSVSGIGTAPGGSFTRPSTGVTDDLRGAANGIPTVYLTRRLTDRATFGVGVSLPFSSSVEWADNAAGRFVAFQSGFRRTDLTPTIAYQLAKGITLGVGANVGFFSTRLRERLDLARVPALVTPGGPITFGQAGVAANTDFADQDIGGNGVGIGGTVGLLLEPVKWASLGARYQSSQSVDITGTADFTAVRTGLVVPANIPSPTNPAQTAIPRGASVDAILGPNFIGTGAYTDGAVAYRARTPDQVTVGLALVPTKSVRVLADAQYTWWSKVDSVRYDFANALTPDFTVQQRFANTWAWRGAVECTAVKDIAFRLGYAWLDAAVPAQNVTTELPEASRQLFSAGVGYQVSKGVKLDVGYTYLRQPDRIGRAGDGNLPVPTTAQNDGLFRYQTHLFAATLAFAY
ncbi:MAG: outer membrane protein transport protein [Gemmatimonadales bacterium]|nr:outer membrane protein transport protein [Gemmatimonadales bacterium]